MVNKYRKLPVVIEAVQWIVPFDGCMGNVDEILEFCEGKAKYTASLNVPNEPNEQYFTIETLEGNHRASVGDYIIKGINGEFYPCKEDVFNKTYELVE